MTDPDHETQFRAILAARANRRDNRELTTAMVAVCLIVTAGALAVIFY